MVLNWFIYIYINLVFLTIKKELKNVKILTFFNTNEFSNALLPVSCDLGE